MLKLSVLFLLSTLTFSAHAMKSNGNSLRYASSHAYFLSIAKHQASFGVDEGTYGELRREMARENPKGLYTKDPLLNGRLVAAMANSKVGPHHPIEIALRLATEGARLWLLEALKAKIVSVEDFRHPLCNVLTFAAASAYDFKPHKVAQVMQALVEAGADVNLPDPRGYLPIIQSARFNAVETLTVLLAEGAEINKANEYNGETALMAAAGSGCPSALKFLLRRGANKELKALPVQTFDGQALDGQTALDIARARHSQYGNYGNIIELLQ